MEPEPALAFSDAHSRAQLYRSYAEEAERWAERATSDDVRESFRVIAMQWRKLAMDADTHR